jgi:hypothetical protein
MSKIVGAAPVLVVVGVVLLGCGSSSPGTAHSTAPGVAQIGETMVRSVGADLEAILGYNFADGNLGDEWLFIDLALTGLRAGAIEVRQEAISVVTPDGRRIPLPTQKEFIDAYSEVQSAIRRAAVASQPLEATRGGRRPCDLNFLRLPGTGTTRDAIWINQRELCVGMLAFPVAGGVQPGRWRLVIELEESTLDVPFNLGE